MYPKASPMKSQNFEFLRQRYADIADLGAFAEAYLDSDPQSAITKLRIFGERMVGIIYDRLGLQRPQGGMQLDMLGSASIRQALPEVIINKLHFLRMQGNQAAHGKSVSTASANATLREGFDLACWFHLAFGGGSQGDCPTFASPTTVDSKGELKRQRKAALERADAAEAQLAKVIADLDAARAQVQSVEADRIPLKQVLVTSQAVANTLSFSEAETRRRLIDQLLVAADWNVGNSGADTEAVKQEVQVLHQRTASDEGWADYVLMDDNGKPLAVVEAKKTAESAEKGKHQARLYADGLEKMYGQRPIIFYTNGYDLFIWDDATNEVPRRLFGFYSKDSLQRLMLAKRNRRSLAAQPHDPKIIDRMYQIEAVRRVCELFDPKSGQRKGRKALLAGC